MRFFLLILFAALLGGCGFKGPLYLPEKPPAAHPQPAPQPEKPQKQDSDQQQEPQTQ
jgi:predicted small lipoprotein YifL